MTPGKRDPAIGVEPGRLANCLTSARLHLILMPTEACNFRCVYCYETFSLGRMPPGVVESVKRLLGRRAAGLEHLTLSWFGGEPLLAIEVIEDVMRYARKLRGSFPSLTVASDITTNAYLLGEATAARLLDLGVAEYQISLDGPHEWHDRKRVRSGGGGTFDRVWGNLLALRRMDRDFRVTIRLHVDRENESVLPGFLDVLASEFGADPRFELFLRALGRLGGPNDGSLRTYGAGEERSVVDRLRGEAAALGLRLTRLPPPPAICYAAWGNSFIVRSDGALNKCTVALEHPNNRVGRLLEDGSVEIDRARMLPWMRGLPTGDADELECPMRGLADAVRLPATGSESRPGTE